jgi:6-pyruvoyltetrahydropterin/6-carboxytetrahydropterin synthase
VSLTTLHLAKQNFKFSAAHFLIFDAHRAERLHGHNYQVKVDIGIPEKANLQDTGYFVDFNIFKKHIKDRLDSWDEIVLLPEKHPEMKFIEKAPSLEVSFRDRFYVFPLNEVKLLPVTNTSVEQFSRLLAEDFLAEFQKHGVESIQVWVEETQGQAASSRVELARK